MSTMKIGNIEHRAYKLVLYNYPLHASPLHEIRLTKLITKALIIEIDESWLADMLIQDAEDKIKKRIQASLH
jgi:hypothetical protein